VDFTLLKCINLKSNGENISMNKYNKTINAEQKSIEH
jgi:hypothetical protein